MKQTAEGILIVAAFIVFYAIIRHGRWRNGPLMLLEEDLTSDPVSSGFDASSTAQIVQNMIEEWEFFQGAESTAYEKLLSLNDNELRGVVNAYALGNQGRKAFTLRKLIRAEYTHPFTSAFKLKKRVLGRLKTIGA